MAEYAIQIANSIHQYEKEYPDEDAKRSHVLTMIKFAQLYGLYLGARIVNDRRFGGGHDLREIVAEIIDVAQKYDDSEKLRGAFTA
jgi:hypothetical protein